MRRSGRSLLRHASILLALGAVALVGAPTGFAAQGPAPEPAPPRTNLPKPEPSPGAVRREPRRAIATTAQTTPPPPAAPAVQAVQPPAPAPPPAAPTPSPPTFVPSPPPPAPVRQQPRRAQTAGVVKKKVSRTKKTKRPAGRALPRPRPAAATAQAASGDSTLLIAGLALVVLVLGDTLFMALSVRYLRSTG